MSIVNPIDNLDLEKDAIYIKEIEKNINRFKNEMDNHLKLFQTREAQLLEKENNFKFGLDSLNTLISLINAVEPKVEETLNSIKQMTNEQNFILKNLEDIDNSLIAYRINNGKKNGSDRVAITKKKLQEIENLEKETKDLEKEIDLNLTIKNDQTYDKDSNLRNILGNIYNDITNYSNKIIKFKPNKK